MIYINKTIEPQSYSDFLSNNAAEIQTKIADPSETGVKMWNWFRTKKTPLKALQLKLLIDQGYVCCYCGEHIFESKVVIEHLVAKGDKNNVFPFTNLYASCIGGKSKPHTIGANETLVTLSARFNVTTAVLQSINPGATFAPGTSIRVYPADYNGKHCDHKKEGDILVNKPNEPKIYERLKYEFNSTSNEVEIKTVDTSDAALENDINNILGLNQKTLKERRAIILKQVDQLLDQILIAFQTDDDIISAFLNLFHQYKNKTNGKFDPFYFVCMSYVNDQGLKYIDN